MTEDDSFRKVLKKVPGASALSGGTDRLVAAHQERLDQLQAQVDQQELSLRSLTVAVNALEHHLPNVLNTVASDHGAHRQLRRDIDEIQLDLQSQVSSAHERLDTVVTPSLEQLFERVEVVRKEILFELRYSRGAPAPSTDAPTEVRVVDEGRLVELTADLVRLNIGCGHIPIDGYVNVDMRELPGVDVVAPVDQLPFDDGVLDELYSAHLLEHFPLEELRRRLLPYWIEKLRPGGTLRAVVPDAQAMIDRYGAGEIPYEQFREVFFGGQEYEGDFHFNMFTTESLSELFADVGLEDVRVEASDRPNGKCYEFQIAATRPV